MKTKGVIERATEPEDKPAYWNNKPKDDGPNAFLELSKMKTDCKKNKEEQKAQQNVIIQETGGDSEDLWYKEESGEFQENLKEYQHIMADKYVILTPFTLEYLIKVCYSINVQVGQHIKINKRLVVNKVVWNGQISKKCPGTL